jgi:hypothetical protein
MEFLFTIETLTVNLILMQITHSILFLNQL